ncbi:MAG TPA: IPT/TIG domain-containing protein [Actinocrinis sp.]|nr:IPT/TIG domain-containing protein [Actinocrinis sp.]
MPLPIPVRLPGRRRHRRLVAVGVAVALASTVLSPTAEAAAAAPKDQSQNTTFYSWGTDYNGQIGNGTTTDEFSPQAITLPGGVAPVQSSVGYQFDLMLGSDGQIYSWGDDADEELGDSTTTARYTPKAISLPGGLAATGVSAGNNYALALGADGQVYWWGTQRGDGQGRQQLPTLLPLPGGDTARSVQAFEDVDTAIGVDGKLFIWGQNYYDSLGDGTGQNQITPEQLVLPGDDAVASVAVGEGFGLAVGVDGKLFSWGAMSADGELGDGAAAAVQTPAQIFLPGDVPATAVADGEGYGIALGADGRVYTWGQDNTGDLGNGQFYGDDVLTPTAITLPGNALASSIGTSFFGTSFAIGQDGALYAWGNNSLGQLGDGTTARNTTPKAVAIPGGTPIGSVAAGAYVVLAIPGSAAAQLPPAFLIQSAPPLTGMTGAVYSAFLPASGNPAYSLADAPAWLTVTPDGAVIGTPPSGTSSFSYSVTAENAVGSATAGPFTVAVAAAAAVSGTVVREGSGALVPGAVVQSCTTGVVQCQQTVTGTDGSFSMPAPVGSSVVLSAFPLPGSGGTTTSTNPITVPAGGIQNETISVNGTAALPTGLEVNGSVGTPALYWASPSTVTLTGCADGIATVSVTGENTETGSYDGNIIALTESPAGSGNYSGVIPPQYPVHGPVEIDDSVTCPPSGPVLPPTGPNGGGTQVSVSGSGFTGATGVSFGNAPAASFVVVDDGGIEAVAPAGTGTVDVTVQINGTTDVIGQYTYMQVASVSPASGPQAGGTAVTITGTGLSDAVEVDFGPTAAQFTQVSDTRITAVSPPGSGTQDITVENLEGDTTATVAADQFGYAGEGGSARPSSTKATTTIPAAIQTVTASPTRILSAGNGISTGTPTRPAGSGAGTPAAVKPRLSIPSVTTLIDTLDQYVPSIPGVPAYLKGLVESAKFAIKPNCATGQAAFARDAVAYYQPEINVAAAGLMLTIKIGLPGFLTSIGVGIPAAAAILSFVASPWGYRILTIATRVIVNTLALVAAKVTAAALFAAFCPSEAQGADAYIDPSGTVLDSNGNPVDGATVTLLRADTAAGPFTPLDPTGPGIEPGVNPQTTGPDGTFHWDVYSGWYEVQATAPGCSAPGSPGQAAATIGPYPVPPPQVGLIVTLDCAGQSAPPTPTVTSLDTDTGPATGGTTVSILGTGFTPASTVDFGTTPGTAVTYLSPQALTVTSPQGTGLVDVTVHNPGAASATSAADQFTYGSPPTVSGLSTASGPVSGGTTVTISGTGFTGAQGVAFGGVTATSFTVESDTQIQATTPTAPSGTVDVQVENPAGTSTTSAADQFTFTAVPITFSADTPPATLTVGKPYTYTYAASGSPAPTYSLASGSLPPGVTLNATTGVLSGTPTAAGAYTFTVTAANGTGTPAVSPPATITASNPAGPAIDNQATITGTTAVTANLSTATPGDLIVAFVSGDGPTGSNQKAKVTGGGLTWTLAKRGNNQNGTAEIWTARATGTLTAAAITATLTTANYGEALTVVAFGNAPGTGQTASAAKAEGAPTASLTTTTANSWVFAVGNDWTASVPRTVGPNQTLRAQSTDSRGDTYWVQSTTGPTPTVGTAVTINDTAPTTDNWNLALLEIT